MPSHEQMQGLHGAGLRLADADLPLTCYLVFLEVKCAPVTLQLPQLAGQLLCNLPAEAKLRAVQDGHDHLVIAGHVRGLVSTPRVIVALQAARVSSKCMCMSFSHRASLLGRVLLQEGCKAGGPHSCTGWLLFEEG